MAAIEAWRHFIEAGLTSGEFEEHKDVSEKTITDILAKHLPEDNGSSEMTSEILQTLQRGKRWMELSSLFGDEIIFLASFGPYPPYQKGKFDLLDKIESSNDVDFTRLKQILAAKCPWIGDTCRKLEGVLQLIITAEGMEATEMDAKIQLAQQINEKARSVFGSHLNFREVIAQDIEKSSRPAYLMMHSLCLLLVGCEKEGSEMGQGEERRASTFNELAAMKLMEVMRAHDFSDESWRRSLTKQLRQGFYQVIDEFTGDCGSVVHGSADQNEGKSRKSWLLIGTDAYIGVVNILLRSEVDGELDQAKLEKLIGKGREAFCAALL
jgi:hypothetical protein